MINIQREKGRERGRERERNTHTHTHTQNEGENQIKEGMIRTYLTCRNSFPQDPIDS